MATAKPKISWLNHKGERFRRGSFKSFSYRYEISEADGPAGSPVVAPGTAIIETRYRGQSASWNLQPSVLSPEIYSIGGTFIHPSPENILKYPPKEPAAAAKLAPQADASSQTAAGITEALKPEISPVSEDRKEALREFTRRLIARAFPAGATP